MSMEAALVVRLGENAPVAAIVATTSDSAKAISWEGFQRGDGYPAIALTMISPGEDWTHEGPDGLDRPRVRFDLRARDAVTLQTLVDAVKTLMRGGQDVSGWRFHPAMLEANRTIDLGEQDGGAMLFQRQLEFLFFHEEI